MKNIAYIELDTHAEIAENFIELMDDRQEFAIEYFFSRKIAGSLRRRPLQAVVCEASELYKLLESKKYNLVIIGTVHRNFELFNKICRRFPTAFIVHNQNFQTAPRWKLFLNCFKKQQAYRLKLLLSEGLLQAPNLYRNAKFRLVLDASIAGATDVFLPLFFNEEKNLPQNSLPKIVVPGAVSQQRRDYRHIFESILHFKSPFEIVLLGKASGHILHEIRKTESHLPNYIKLSYFEEKIPRAEFRNALKSADLLWCPLQPRAEFFSFTEIYGKTKMSGNTGDAIFAGRYAVFPKKSLPELSFAVAEERNPEEQFIGMLNLPKPDPDAEFEISAVREKLFQVLHSIS